MPITREMLAKYVLPTFIETGTYRCEAVDHARDLGFQAIHTMDVDKKHVDAARAKGYENVYQGDSPDVLAKILPDIEGPITFWLDAHPFERPLDIFHTRFPLMRELRTIREHVREGGHVLLMDDMRVVGEWEKALLMHGLKLLWPHAELGWEGDRYCDDDILVCDLRGGK